jgi:peptide/nickel transport system substrate-binding protein
MDPDSKMIPGLATSWKTIDDTTWEFKLRKGVKFHDGSELTAEDVVFSIDRVPLVPNSPGRFTAYTKAIVSKQIVDPYTLRLKYAAPYPLAPNDLSTIYIVSKKVAANATTDDFNSGKAAIGSGRFKFVKYVNGDRVELVRNDNYWGDKPVWDKVTFRIIKSEPARVAALLSGDVDAMEGVPTADLARLKADPKFNVTSKISHRVIYFNFDYLDRVSPFIFAKDGKPLAKNPLLDVRVRRAMSKAINRPAIAERVMEGQAIPSGQLVSATLFGNVPSLKADAFDPEGAKKLLAEAGYPDGFNITIHGPSGRYVNDEKIVQAVAQMLARVGIAAKVETAPMGPYSSPRVEAGVQLPYGRLGCVDRRSILAVALAARDLQYGQGPGRGELGPLQQPQGRLPDRAGAAAGGRREPPDHAAAGDRAGHVGPRDHADPFPVHDLGDGQGRDLRPAHRRIHAGVPVQAGERLNPTVKGDPVPLAG